MGLEKEVSANMKPGTATAAATKTETTEVISWQLPCGATCEILRQVTTSCPDGCQGTPPAHHHHPQPQGSITEQSNTAGRSITGLTSSPLTPEIKLDLEKEVSANMKPGTAAAAATKTTEVISWQLPCGATCEILRQVTTSCPHGCQGTPPAHHHHPQGSITEQSNTAGRSITLTPAPAVVPELWVAEPNVMVQQLRELEPLLGDKALALRVQLEEYTEAIERSKRDSARTGRDWFLTLPLDVREAVVLARDAITSELSTYAA